MVCRFWHRKITWNANIFNIGHVNKLVIYELPLGISFQEVIDVAGGILDGKKLKAVIPGGSSTKVLPADIIENCTMDYESLQDVDSALGILGHGCHIRRDMHG